MPLIDDAFAALTDMRVTLNARDRIGCHVLIFSPKTRERRENWHKVAMQGSVADRIASSAREALLKLENRATDDQALEEFDFDAMADGCIGVMSLADVPAIANWLDAIPGDDWPLRFDGDEQVIEKARFYVTRLNFADGRLLTLVRGSRGLTVTLREQGMVAAIFSREQNEMVAIDGAVVSFDGAIDFLAWEGMVFILNFRTFESVTNIRDVTIRKATGALDDLAARFGLGNNIQAIKDEIGKRTLLAKRLAAAHRHGIIADVDPQSLVDRAAEKQLRLRCHMNNGNVHFDIDHNNQGEIQDFVDLLTDFFLKSPVTGREWEAVVKRTPKARR
ncbi:Kiwa anti-phage protein KwaB-like domain-containing protein [Azospirillum sp. A29]|uniref:Kiwa anti-phage protein KwaB-like domain-containing protein n=1 Tax=Azospirillum sp. A29 TaxID=3160606 RepID=UPI0036722472